ncbi:MAG: hypothetical protein M1812_007298 [Candelaria pacifica]|nr:MAG: hypothetical protein M1812_007298 [Candelaria pacifica]
MFLALFKPLVFVLATLLEPGVCVSFTKESLAGAKRVEFAPSDLLSQTHINVSYHSVEVNLTTNHWEGKTWHYSLPDPETGKLDEFSIAVIDYEFPDDDSEALFPRANTTALQPAAVEADLIPGWVCDWVYGCVNVVTLGIGISAAQIVAVKNAINDRLRANNNELFKRLFDGIVIGISVAVAATPFQYYITNKIQQDSLGAQNSCAPNGDWTTTLNELKADIDDLKKIIQSGNTQQARTYDHYSENPGAEQEGVHTRHAVKVTQSSSDFNPVHC